MLGKLLGILIFFEIFLLASPTPLDDYVWAPDENYGWQYMGQQYDFNGSIGSCSYKGYYVNMTSQRWLTDADFTPDSKAKSIWWHVMIIVVPDQIRFKNNASLYITGTGMGVTQYNKSEDAILGTVLACSIGSITGVLFQIPNENIIFSSDTFNRSRGEDAAIAFTWQHFLNDPTDPTWLIRFPMVKASVRALDTMTAFVNTHLASTGCQLDYFLVAGASKRGWTTWLVGAVDPVRVKAIVPIVLDAINFVPVMHHTFRSYGGWSFALKDYIEDLERPITSRFDEPNMILLQQFVDPYYYRDRLTMPKLVVNALMDEFQQPDDTHYWWKDMPEPKHFLIAPNAEHTMATGVLMVVPSIGAFGLANFLNQPVPTFSWELDVVNGSITATVDNDMNITDVNVWWAYSCGVNSWDNNMTRRDFRLVHKDNPCYCGNNISQGYCANLAALWDKRTLQPIVVNGQRTYVASHADFDPPSVNPKRWISFMIEFKFDNPYGLGLFKDVKEEVNKIIKKKLGNRYFSGLPEDLGGFFDFTTEVIIWPNEFPYEDCHGEECGSRIV